MNWGATVRTIVLCAVLIFLHYTLRPLLAWRASADFLIIALLLASVRVRPGVAALFGFVLGLAFQTAISVLQDPASRKRGVLRKSLRGLKGSPLLSKDLWRQLKEYDAKGFHPDDRDTIALVEEWREKLFGAEGTLNDKLIGAA